MKTIKCGVCKSRLILFQVPFMDEGKARGDKEGYGRGFNKGYHEASGHWPLFI